MNRRRALLALSSLPLAGCGFALKRPPQLAAQRVLLTGFVPLSTMGAELRRQLLLSPGVTLVDTPEQAQLVLNALLDRRERVVASSTATGLVSELTLRARLRFEVRDGQGKLLIPETELVQIRDMGFQESVATAKEHESDMLFRAMESDVATQVLRRMAALAPH